MPRLSREDYLNRIQQLVPGDDEDSLNLIADLIDSYDGAPAPTENWEERYNNLRKMYRERFFNGNINDNDIVNDPAPEAENADIVDTENAEPLTEAQIFDKYMPPVEE